MENSFDSIDRLMEFGMSMAVAQQMMNTMNNAMANMHVAGAGTPVMKTVAQYYAVINGGQVGPMTEAEVMKMVEADSICEDTQMWKTGAAAWVQAKQLPEINKIFMLRKINKQ